MEINARSKFDTKSFNYLLWLEQIKNHNQHWSHISTIDWQQTQPRLTLMTLV